MSEEFLEHANYFVNIFRKISEKIYYSLYVFYYNIFFWSKKAEN
jgi:hypothetical protein